MRESFDTRGPGPTAGAPSIEELQAALAREQARTREVDHRAKNTLQLISSLLLLASRRSACEESRAALNAMHQRVAAVAAAHRSLHEAAHADSFDLTQLVRELATRLAQSHGAAIRSRLDPLEAEPAVAAPLALILNELLMNALVHAGGDGRGPEIGVDLRQDGDGFSLTVQDDGRGPEAAKTAGFGLTMVRLLAQQIGARFAMEDAQPGLRAVVTRP